MAVRALPLAAQLTVHGHQVRAFMPVREAADLHGPHAVDGVTVEWAKGWLPIPLLHRLSQLVELGASVLRWRPDLVYCFKPIAFSGALLWFLWWMRRVGLFSGGLLLDTDDWEGFGGWNERQPFPVWLKRVVAWQEAWSLRHADLVTVASRELERMARELGARRLLYLPNGLGPASPGLLEPQEPELRSRLGLSGQPVILLYTRFVEYQPGRVVQVLRELIRYQPEATLLVVGAGMAGEEEKLLSEAISLGVGERVRLMGWLNPEQVASSFRAADVAIYPMDDNLLNRTKCPMKLVELMAAGVPVVADAVGQALEYMEHGVTGWLVPAGDWRAMAQGVAALLENPGLRAAIGDRAQAKARSVWRWDLLAQELDRELSTVR